MLLFWLVQLYLRSGCTCYCKQFHIYDIKFEDIWARFINWNVESSKSSDRPKFGSGSGKVWDFYSGRILAQMWPEIWTEKVWLFDSFCVWFKKMVALVYFSGPWKNSFRLWHHFNFYYFMLFKPKIILIELNFYVNIKNCHKLENQSLSTEGLFPPIL